MRIHFSFILTIFISVNGQTEQPILEQAPFFKNILTANETTINGPLNELTVNSSKNTEINRNSPEENKTTQVSNETIDSSLLDSMENISSQGSSSETKLSSTSKNSTTNTTNQTLAFQGRRLSESSNDSILLYDAANTSESIPSWLNKSSSELTTFLSDHYNYFVTGKGNRVWAGALNLAWNQLRRTLLNGENATFSNLDTAVQQRLVQNLNLELFSKDELSENSYYVTSGFGQQTINKINRQTRQKFPNKIFEDLNFVLQDHDFMAYSYIFKQLSYSIPFSSDDYFYFKGQKVQAFKAINSKQKQQLYFKYFNDKNDFLMGIQTTNPNDEILLLKNPNQEFNYLRFEKVLKIVGFYDSYPNQKLTSFDKFSMPILKFDFTRTIAEMQGLQFSNERACSAKITGVLQKINLQMTKEGVKVQNSALLFVSFSESQSPKYFYLNKDFWLILKEKNKSPYLVMLVRNVTETWSN